MIYVKNTANYTGVTIYGDFLDFEALYEALHTIVGEEGEHMAYAAARIRVLAICYDIRHAMMGNRDAEFVENGMDADKMRHLSIASSEKDTYLAFQVLWPEIVFVMMSLNDFVRLHAKKQSKHHFDILTSKENIWDGDIAQVKAFQAAVAAYMKETLPASSYSRTRNLMVKDYTWTDGYTFQYLDVLNDRFLEMDREKRFENLSIMAKRIAEKGQEYQEVTQEVAAAAKKHNCSVSDIRIKVDYPDDIDW